MPRVGTPAPDPARELYDDLFAHTPPDRVLDDLGRGVLTVLEHVPELLTDVDILVSVERFARARFLLATADEELGKAHLLIDAARLDFAKHEGTVKALCRGFYDHVVKFAYWRAWRQPHTALSPEYGERFATLFSCDLARWWPGGDPEDGEPDLPHDTAFHRDMNLYVYYSHYARGGWVAPVPTQRGWDFGRQSVLGDLRVVTREHLATFQVLAAGNAFSRDAMLALYDVWRRLYVKAETAESDVDRLRDKTAAAVAAVTSCTPETVRASPLCMWPCYSFLVEPKPIR